MRFENDTSVAREKVAIEKFVNIFDGSFKKLGPNDVDFRVFNKSGELVAYVEVKGRFRTIKEAYPLPVAARKIVKLCDKRLNPVMVWSCLDGIIYAKVSEIQGEVKWGGRKPREHSVNDEELMVYYEKQKGFKYVRF
tara:strand:- start:2349 stop:2759 length:411 start_codon:yes stop_codon:yes gene_type:complete